MFEPILAELEVLQAPHVDHREEEKKDGEEEKKDGNRENKQKKRQIAPRFKFKIDHLKDRKNGLRTYYEYTKRM